MKIILYVAAFCAAALGGYFVARPKDTDTATGSGPSVPDFGSDTNIFEPLPVTPPSTQGRSYLTTDAPFPVMIQNECLRIEASQQELGACRARANAPYSAFEKVGYKKPTYKQDLTRFFLDIVGTSPQNNALFNFPSIYGTQTVQADAARIVQNLRAASGETYSQFQKNYKITGRAPWVLRWLNTDFYNLVLDAIIETKGNNALSTSNPTPAPNSKINLLIEFFEELSLAQNRLSEEVRKKAIENIKAQGYYFADSPSA